MNKKFDLEVRETIKQKYLDGMSASQIAKEIGTSCATITKYLKDEGIQVVNKQNVLNYTIEEVISLYNNGISLTKIAEKLNTTRNTLSRNLKKAGIDVVNRQNAVKFNEKIFDTLDSEESVYWLGFIFADGYISSRDNTFELSLKASDAQHLHKFNTFSGHIKDNVKIEKVTCNSKLFSRCRWSIVNKYLWERLNSLGCTPNKSLILKFPDYIKTDLHFKWFLRGYFDGDGCLTYKRQGDKLKPQVSLLGTDHFISVIQDKLKELHICSYKYYCESKGVYDLRISSNDCLKFLHFIYDDALIFLDRKFKRFEFFKDCRSVKELTELLEEKNGED